MSADPVEPPSRCGVQSSLKRKRRSRVRLAEVRCGHSDIAVAVILKTLKGFDQLLVHLARYTPSLAIRIDGPPAACEGRPASNVLSAYPSAPFQSARGRYETIGRCPKERFDLFGVEASGLIHPQKPSLRLSQAARRLAR